MKKEKFEEINAKERKQQNPVKFNTKNKNQIKKGTIKQ